MFVPPPLVEFTSVESQVKKPRGRNGDVLPDGILEFRFIDEDGNGTKGFERRKNIGPGPVPQLDSLRIVFKRGEQRLQTIHRFSRLFKARRKLNQQAA